MGRFGDMDGASPMSPTWLPDAIADFHASEAVTFTPPDPIAPVLLARQRGRIRRQVVNCAACELRAGCSAPVAMSTPAPPSPRAVCSVVGEGPGPDEDRRGAPFVGKSGRVIRDMMRQAGIDPEMVAWMNVVSCYPHTGEGGPQGKGKKPKAPGEEHIRSCRMNLMGQLEAANSEYVLLVGATAMRMWRPDLTLTEHHGTVGVWDHRYLVMPVFHPAGILRNPALRLPLIEDVRKWAEVIGPDGDLDWLGTSCIACGAGMRYMDPDGIAYCERHWARYGGMWRKAREGWDSPVVKRKKGDPLPDQEEMF